MDESGATGARRGWTVALGLALGLFAFAVCVFPLRSMDVWWHLRTGREILALGELPRTDWYTYTVPDRPWIDLHWGFQLFAHGVHTLGGTDLLILVKAAFASAAVLVVWRSWGRGASPATGAVAMALVAVVASGQALVRPGFVTLLLLAVSLALLRRAEHRPRAVLWLVPLQVLWVNVQGLFVLGVVVVGLWLAARLVRRALGTAPEESTLRLELGAVAGVTLACFANPWLVDGAFFPLELWRKFGADREAYSVVLEFRPPLDFIAEHGWRYGYLAFQGAVAALALTSFVALLFRGRLDLFRALLFGAFGFLALKALRNADVFALVAGAVWLENLAELRKLKGEEREPAWRSLVGLAVLGALLASLPGGHLHRLAGDGRRLGLGEPEAWYMHGPAEFAGRPEAPGGAFVRHIGQAAVYTFVNGPSRKVFMDGRLEVSTVETLARFHDASERMAASDPSFEELIRLPNGELPLVLLDAGYSMAQLRGLLRMPERWRVVFADRSGVVLCERATAERIGWPEVSPAPVIVQTVPGRN